MKPTIQQIKDLDKRAVSLSFSDGCSMDVRIVDTMHLDEGDDFAADVLRVNCRSAEHWHASPGNCINIRLPDIVSLEPIEEDQPTTE